MLRRLLCTTGLVVGSAINAFSCGESLGVDETESPPMRDSGDDPADTETDASAARDGAACDGCLSGSCRPDGGCDPLVFVGVVPRDGRQEADAGTDMLAHVDGLCTKAARIHFGRGNFVAWLSTADASAGERLGPLSDRPFVRRDGRVVASDVRGLLSGSLLLPIALGIADGQEVFGPVWTGTESDGGVGATCADWSSNGGGERGTTGLAESAKLWTAGERPTPCNEKARLYCFEIVE